jgi:hypothetical protein
MNAGELARTVGIDVALLRVHRRARSACEASRLPRLRRDGIRTSCDSTMPISSEQCDATRPEPLLAACPASDASRASILALHLEPGRIHGR